MIAQCLSRMWNMGIVLLCCSSSLSGVETLQTSSLSLSQSLLSVSPGSDRNRSFTEFQTRRRLNHPLSAVRCGLIVRFMARANPEGDWNSRLVLVSTRVPLLEIRHRHVFSRYVRMSSLSGLIVLAFIICFNVTFGTRQFCFALIV